MVRSRDLYHCVRDNTQYKYQYDYDLLETFENVHPEMDYWVTLNADESTSLCPKTA